MYLGTNCTMLFYTYVVSEVPILLPALFALIALITGTIPIYYNRYYVGT